MLKKALLGLALLLLAAGVALVVVLIAGDSDDDATPADPGLEVSANGTLRTDPEPLSATDVKKLPQDSAERAVMSLLYWGQWGNLPAIVEGYDPEVIDGLTIPAMTGAYSNLRPQLVSSLPRISSVQEEDDQTFVTLELLSASSPPQRESFLLVRRDGEWRVIFDTLLERGVSAYVEQTADANPDEAAKVGEQAAQNYRNIAPSLGANAPDG